MIGMLLATVLGTLAFAFLLSGILTFAMIGPVHEAICLVVSAPTPTSEEYWFTILAHALAAGVQLLVAAVLVVLSRLAVMLGI